MQQLVQMQRHRTAAAVCINACAKEPYIYAKEPYIHAVYGYI